MTLASKDAGARASRPEGASPQGAEPPRQRGPRTLEERLFAEPYCFDFFQAVRILQALQPKRVLVGMGGPPSEEIARFRSHISLTFPPSAIYDLTPPTKERPLPVMVESFFGLTGPNGVLPRHYTELLFRLDRDAKGPERHLLRDWLDLFNHRLVSLFYRAWEKYRFYLPFERGEFNLLEPDPFTRALLSFIGLGIPQLRRRLQIVAQPEGKPETAGRVVAKVDDLALLFYSGFLSHRPRSAAGLEAILGDYFQFPAELRQFHAQWLILDSENQTSLGGEDGNNQLGISAIAGDRVWDVQSKFRLRLGPLNYKQFVELVPDPAPIAERKGFFLLVHLVRLYAGPEFDFDVQLVLKAEEVHECYLADTEKAVGARLGWNTWLLSVPCQEDVDDAVFEGELLISVPEGENAARSLGRL